MDNLRPVLYISLVLILFLIWQAWQRDYGPQPEPETPAQVSERQDGRADAARDDLPGDMPEAPVSEAQDIPVETVPEPERNRIRVVTDVLDLEIDTRGGDLVRADL